VSDADGDVDGYLDSASHLLPREYHLTAST